MIWPKSSLLFRYIDESPEGGLIALRSLLFMEQFLSEFNISPYCTHIIRMDDTTQESKWFKIIAVLQNIFCGIEIYIKLK